MYGTFADPHQHALYAGVRQLGGVSGMGAGALAANQIYNLGERITYPQSVEVPVERRYLTADQEAYYYPY